MRLLSFRASGWRNLHSLELAPGHGLNVISGQNAQGKTSLLESIFFLASLRSFRTNRLSELVGWGESQALLRGAVDYRQITSSLGVMIGGNRRLLEVDGAPVSRSQDYFVGFSVVLFAPGHLSLVRGEPRLRRNFIDRALFGIQQSHLAVVRRYDAVLRQRNACLARYASDQRAGGKLLDTLDVQLSESAEELVTRRRELVDELGALAGDVFEAVARQRVLDISYRVKGERVPGEYRRWLLRALAESRSSDFDRGHTQLGPHRDDLVIRLRGRAAARVASQGEARSIVLSLKLGEALLIRARHGESPVLLMDDVGSELDARRRDILFGEIGELGAQTFVTTVDTALVPIDSGSQLYHLHDGAITCSVR